jgi:hypothetical protein
MAFCRTGIRFPVVIEHLYPRRRNKLEERVSRMVRVRPRRPAGQGDPTFGKNLTERQVLGFRLRWARFSQLSTPGRRTTRKTVQDFPRPAKVFPVLSGQKVKRTSVDDAGNPSESHDR